MRAPTLAATVAAAFLTVGCQSDPMSTPDGDFRPNFAVVDLPGDGVANFEEFEVCKTGSGATFDFTVTDRSNGAVTNGSVTLADGECRVIAQFGGQGADVSITEQVPTGFDLEDVDVVVVTGTSASPVFTPRTEAGPTVTDFVSGSAGGGLRGVLATFNNVAEPPPPPPGGGEGCTPGYWKQSHHFDSWPTGILPTDLFDTYFDNAFPGKTLVDVLRKGGGGLIALGRHTVAAFLSASSTGVDYDLTAADVVTKFNAAFASGDYKATHNEFANFNEQGCPLN